MVRPGDPDGAENGVVALHPDSMRLDYELAGLPPAAREPRLRRVPADPLLADPTLAPLLPALEAWRAVPGGVVVTSDAGLARHLHRRFGLHTVPVGRAVAGPCLRIPSLSERGPEAVRAALASFSCGRRILPDLLDHWTERAWLGGWAEIAAALTDLDARCPRGPLHMLAVRARRPDLLAPPAPELVVEVSSAGPLARQVLTSRGLSFEACGVPGAVVPGDAVLELAAWPEALSGRVRLEWGRHGVRVRVDDLPEGWSVRAASDSRGEATPVVSDVPVVLGTRGQLAVWQADSVRLTVRVAPPAQAEHLDSPAPEAPPLRRTDRKILLDTILEATASTVPLADALPVLVSRHASPGAAALAARLGVSPVATVSRWLANPRNEPLRLVLADGLAATEDPAARRARLPRALRCWIPRWPRTAASPAMPLPLRLVGAAPAAAVGSDWVGGLDPIKR